MVFRGEAVRDLNPGRRRGMIETYKIMSGALDSSQYGICPRLWAIFGLIWGDRSWGDGEGVLPLTVPLSLSLRLPGQQLVCGCRPGEEAASSARHPGLGLLPQPLEEPLPLRLQHHCGLSMPETHSGGTSEAPVF